MNMSAICQGHKVVETEKSVNAVDITVHRFYIHCAEQILCHCLISIQNCNDRVAGETRTYWFVSCSYF
jgi:hypothetical protein